MNTLTFVRRSLLILFPLVLVSSAARLVAQTAPAAAPNQAAAVVLSPFEVNAA